MELHELKRQIQDHLSDGLVLIAGSGLSAAAGLPTMTDLASHLLNTSPTGLTDESQKKWTEFKVLLESGTDLENALNQIESDFAIETHVILETASLLHSKEKRVIDAVVNGKQSLPLSPLLNALIKTSKQLPIITTNYDRLIELAAENAQISIDTSFYGQFVGHFDPTNSREALGYAAQTRTRSAIKRVYRPHVQILKPHGSLDWYVKNNTPVRILDKVNLPRLMITPGKSKYKKGYDQPFDRHREEANKAVDRAARFLIIGYGFNDQQLETHLRPRLQHGAPCIILARTLTANGFDIIKSSPNTFALTMTDSNGELATKLTQQKYEKTYPNTSLWDLQSLIGEILT